MNYPQSIFLLLWACLCANNLSAQTKEDKEQAPKRYYTIDMTVASMKKAAESSKSGYRKNPWKTIEHNCEIELPFELDNAFLGVPKQSQASLLNLVKGGVKISNQVIQPIERQLMASEYFRPGISKELFECLTGCTLAEKDFQQSHFLYIEDLSRDIAYARSELYGESSFDSPLPYTTPWGNYKCRMIRTKADLDSVMSHPNEIGLTYSLRGGHVFSDLFALRPDEESGETNLEILGRQEFGQLVLNSVNQLKGILPIRQKTGEYLSVPIFSISFGNYFEDGIVGKVSRFNTAQQEVFGEQNSLGKGFTELGQWVCRRLLDKKVGRRILVDVADMSLEGRLWFYGYLKEERFRKDTIPALALNVGISGLSYKDNAYSGSDEPVKNQQSFFNNRQANLCRQDIKAIVKSKGLVGISLDRDRLMGKAFQTRYNSTVPGSANRRAVAVEAIVANVCRFIYVAQSIDAWEMLSISSSFDMYARPLEVYDSSDDMEQLYHDLIAFFENPHDIEGLYTAEEIQTFMYNFSAEELVDRIMYKNALNFMYKHLPELDLTEEEANNN